LIVPFREQTPQQPEQDSQLERFPGLWQPDAPEIDRDFEHRIQMEEVSYHIGPITSFTLRGMIPPSLAETPATQERALLKHPQ
jgi:hypothetical protein